MSWDLGVAYFKEAQYDNAINEWGQLEVSAYLDFNIASAYLAKQDLNNAETYFSEAIIYDTEFALAYFSRGYALGLLKDYDEAIETFNECLSILQNSRMIHYNDTLVPYQLHYCEVLHNRGVMYFESGQTKQAQQDFDDAYAYAVTANQKSFMKGFSTPQMFKIRHCTLFGQDTEIVIDESTPMKRVHEFTGCPRPPRTSSTKPKISRPKLTIITERFDQLNVTPKKSPLTQQRIAIMESRAPVIVKPRKSSLTKQGFDSGYDTFDENVISDTLDFYK